MNEPRRIAPEREAQDTPASRKHSELDAFVDRFSRGMIDGFRRRFGSGSEADPKMPHGSDARAEVGSLAWAPTDDEDCVTLGAIECAPGTIIVDADDYLARLGERIQRLVDMTDEPVDTAQTLQRCFYGDGLYPYISGVPCESIGQVLVAENLAVRERLGAWRILPIGRDVGVDEVPAARAALLHDLADPIGSLESWAVRISTLR